MVPSSGLARWAGRGEALASYSSKRHHGVRFRSASPFWPYRMASNPFAAPRSEAQLAHARNRAAALRKPIRLEPEIGEHLPEVVG